MPEGRGHCSLSSSVFPQLWLIIICLRIGRFERGGPPDHLLVQWLRGFMRQWYSEPSLITAGFKAKSATGKDAWDKAWRRPCTSFPGSSPSGVTRDALSSSSTDCDNTCDMSVHEGGSFKTKLSLGANHVTSICQNSRPPEGRQGVSINHIVCTNSWGPEGHSYLWGNEGSPPEVQVPRCQAWPTSSAGLSEDSSLRPAVGTLFCMNENRLSLP